MTFAQGQPYMGIDVAEWLERRMELLGLQESAEASLGSAANDDDGQAVRSAASGLGRLE